MKLCDLHTHILPEVDDGAPTMEYALNMLQNAVASDVHLLAVTPHCNRPFGNVNHLDKQLLEGFKLLQDNAKNIPIKLVLGAEVLVNDLLPQLLKQKKIPTINGGRYLLTEFPVDTKPEDFDGMLHCILDLGYIPLIAHPERYFAVCKTPQIVIPWLDLGCHLQLTGGSILGEYGKSIQKAATYLLQKDLVCCVASDAHGLHRRSNFLLDVYDHLTVQYSKQYAQCLMYENPMAICFNQNI